MTVWLYRSLGVVARINQTSNHVRLKGIPLNWLMMAGLGICVAWQGAQLTQKLGQQPVPNQVSISELNQRTLDYVTVEGYLFPESELRLNGTPYIPLIEEDTRRAILIRASRKHREQLEPRLSSVTGRLLPIAPDQKLNVSRADLGVDIYLETDWSLTEGQPSNSAWKHTVVFGLSGILLVAFAVASRKHGVIFEPTSQLMTYKPSESPSSNAMDMHISGCLTLTTPEGKTNLNPSHTETGCRQRFLDIPGTVSSTDHGEIVLMANVDASSIKGLAVTDWKVGWWKSAISSRSIHSLEAGILHLGGNSRPALKFSYREPNGDPHQTVISFSSDRDRQYTYNHLAHSINQESR